jgi:NAD(P)-dependent dehydrogenase (short-subunit alcohol dehydrogenase family)
MNAHPNTDARLPGPNGKVALVTGAGSGIGRAVASALLAAGYAVVLAGRRKPALQETISQAHAGSNALAVPTDVADETSVANLIRTVSAQFGRLDFLFNNAGTGAPPVAFDELTLDQWNAVVSVNLTGAFLCARAAFRQMREQQPQGGRIVNNGSLSAHVPRPLSAPYTATKHAISGLTKSISLDGRPFNIVCGQIDIGNAATDMTSRMSQGVPQANGSLLAEPTMDVRHVADAVVHMANLPLQANVQFMTIMAAMMPYIGRG